ncbi:MAG: peptidylprolyl isomerase, partial [Chitinophagaceae bacterium]
RKALGRIKIAQVLIANPPIASNAEKSALKSIADSVYKALQQGASFELLAGKYSNHNINYAPNGEMLTFGVGDFDQSFETSVFALTKNNEISKPISTSAGYHIVKRLAHIPVNNDPGNDSAIAALKQLVSLDARMEVSAQAMMRKIFVATGLKKAVVPGDHLWLYVVNYLAGKKSASVSGVSAKTLLFSIAGKNFYVDDWLRTLPPISDSAIANDNQVFERALNVYIEKTARETYFDDLGKYEPEFTAQVNEFKEGNLLFEIMQKTIWDKAAADTTGLKKFFETHKDRYWWQPGVEAIIFNCSDSATANSIRKSITGKNNWRKIIESEQKVQADSGRFELSQLPAFINAIPKVGMITAPLKNSADDNYSFLYVVNIYPGKSPRDFEDAKGFVMSDYQSYLEEAWIKQLKKKYPVKLNEPILRSLWKK